MDGCCRVKMATEGYSEPQEPHKSAVRTWAACHSGWRSGAALLCVAGVLCFTLYVKGTQEQSHPVEIEGLTRNLRQISNSVRAAIHLEGKYNKSMRSSVQWNKDVDQYHAMGGLRLEDNEVVVPTNGLYFVYSQASFRLSCQAEMVHLTYMLERWSDSYSDGPEDYKVILHSSRTTSTSPGGAEATRARKWFNSVYVGAVFRLNAGDRLRTVVNNKFLPNVESGNGKTFFGVFAL